MEGYYAQKPGVDVAAGLQVAEVQALDDLQACYDLVFAHYLAGSISLARAAELLGLPWLALRTRCQRLNVPLRTAPGDAEEAARDVAAAAEW